ncbi:hypothetical protein ACFRNT_14315 [Streptomyces sp. NPDC056697]|uniref:hypothetical protein n=1 Tax=Streptomyces sp. NPDC056697 TaxID=3345915 RepID=UPI003678C07C
MLSSGSLATCDNCHQPIRWTITAHGNRQAVDPEPHAEGNTAVYTDGTGTTKSRRITGEYPLLAYEWRAKPHVATCPAPRPRRRTRPARRRAVIRHQDWRRS